MGPHQGEQPKYAAANGSAIPSRGMFDIDWTTVEGHKRHVEFRDADVEFPILSTGRMTDEDEKLLLYHKRGGLILNPFTKEHDSFIKALGVYWVLMICDPSLLSEHLKPDFHRQG